MRDVNPAVVRVIDVPVGVTLGELHGLLQAGFGWTDSHLHQFTADGLRYGVPDPDWNPAAFGRSGSAGRAPRLGSA